MEYSTQMKLKRFFRKPVVTYALLTIQILAFVLMTLDGGSTNVATLVKYGAKFNPYIVLGEWWRLITPMFLHIGFIHLLMNSVILYYLGEQLEGMFGHLRFAGIYLLSGIAGNLASFAFSDALSAGASTALFGLFGSTIMLGQTFKHNPAIQQMAKSFSMLIIINIVFGIFSSSIDMAGHLGGLLGGFLLATAISVPNPLKIWRNERLIYGGLFLLLVIILAYIGYRSTAVSLFGL
ncbi:rhomboid family intramembrane serine protease [Carnobacterium viridans]|uniref:Rhomboid protease GluP n=2 Tax=Carnobacterium viridans TaxID=174587 RepID=A0A1H0Y8P6_9LACT|nr:rhomboid family intramembrane serine protease [Carnobacterium viridans]UDE95282.1 rhomboid family intramembrane serine protease [Carnobacterium viridans]SDQ11527.1 rhomboid protease GluP [Carnobacterium viridans]